MGKYILLYRGPSVEFTPEMNEAWGMAWGKWMEKIGSALLDEGAPFGERGVVAESGAGGIPSEFTGYTIIQADSLSAAQSLAQGNPWIVGSSTNKMDIFELVAM